MKRAEDINEQLKFSGEDPKEKGSYKELFEVLSTEMNFQLPQGFAEKVTLAIDQKESKRNRFFWLLSLTGIAVILISSVIGMMYIYGWEGIRQFENATYWGVTIGLMVALFQYLDQKLIKRPRISGLV